MARRRHGQVLGEALFLLALIALGVIGATSLFDFGHGRAARVPPRIMKPLPRG